MTKNQAFAILQNSGGIRAARIITDHYKKLSKIRVLWIAHQLRRGVPVAKIIHQKWFYGLKFYTSKHTLDPRPDTETLVSAVISDCMDDSARHILDLGTGTGCIICALAKNIQNTTGIAIDKSRRALRIARHNIKTHNLTERIKTRRADFNTKIQFDKPFDIIVSNPPYIAYNDKRVNDAATHDPAIALYAKNNGLAAYESIAKNAKSWITNDGKMYLEIGIDQGIDIKNIFLHNGWNLLNSYPDLSGIERVLVFNKAHQ